LRILITSMWLANPAGLELYTFEIAKALVKKGHTPIVYSPKLGDLAQELRATTIAVVDNLDLIGEPPDLIHGQHHQETMAALLHFPGVPAVYFSHGWLYSIAAPPHFPRILRYVAVDYTVRDRLIYEHGIPPENVTVILNFVDMERFTPRPPLPPKPQRALVFSNQASERNYVSTLREACSNCDIALDVVGMANGNATWQPEKILGEYDLVFAKARAAMESLAVGTAVVLCDVAGAGPMVTSAELNTLRQQNFGIRALQNPITIEGIQRELARYNADDAARVSVTIRQSARLEEAVEQIINLYHRVLDEWSKIGSIDGAEENAATGRYLVDTLNRYYPEVITRERDQARTEVERLRRDVNQLADERDKLRNELSQLTNRQQKAHAEREELRRDLDIIRHSFIFRFIANPIWNMRHRVLPEDSERYRIYRRVRQIVGL